MFIIKHRNIFFTIAVLFVGSAIFSTIFFGLNLGADFKGGSILEASYASERPTMEVIKERLVTADFGDARVQPAGEQGVIVRTGAVEEGEKERILMALSADGVDQVTEERYSTIGPTVGAELRAKAWVAILVVVVTIALFIAYVFRTVSHPVSSWKYGIIALVALVHDVIIPTGIFALLGYEIDSLFIIALLAVLGISINDTIVVFDRIRENLKLKISDNFAETVGKSVEQTFARSLNTSLTVLIVLLTLVFTGPEATRHFSLALALGVFFGTYSSIFLASPLLVEFESRQKNGLQ